MKTKYLIFLLSGLLFSCVDEEIGGGQQGGGEVPEGKAAVDLTLTGIDATTLRSYADFTSTGDESKIDSIMIYIFGNKDGLSSAPMVLQEIESIPASKIAVGANAGERKATFYVDNMGEKDIVAIANGVDTLAIRPGMSYNEFCNVGSRIGTSILQAPFYMQGKTTAKVKTEVGKTVTASIELVRLVARIDITINSNKGGNEFKLLEAAFKNVSDQARLVPDMNSSVTPAVPKTSTDAKLITTPFMTAVAAKANATALGGSDTLWHQLYVNETPLNSDESNRATLVLKGTFRGKAAQYEVPFNKNIMRNTRYLVLVDSVSPTEIQPEILITEWNADTVTYAPSAKNDSLKITFDQAAASANIDFKPDADAKRGIDTLAIPMTASHFYLDIDSSNIEMEVAATKPWVTDSVGNPVTKLPMFSQRIKIMLEDNFTGEGNREAKVFIRNKMKPSDAKTYIVRQKGLLQLPGWADANLASEQKFAQPVVSSYEADTLIYRVGYTAWTAAANDSCPAGWRLPTPQELASIMPTTQALGTYATASGTNVNEAAANLTGVTNATASYSVKDGAITGVKFQNTDNAMAYRWEYKGVTNKYLKITARKVAKNTAVADVDWTADTDKDVVRYFQMTGTGASKNTGSYWTSGAASMIFDGKAAYYSNAGAATTGAVRCVRNIVIE